MSAFPPPQGGGTMDGALPQVNAMQTAEPSAAQPLPRPKGGPSFKPSDLVKKGQSKRKGGM